MQPDRLARPLLALVALLIAVTAVLGAYVVWLHTREVRLEELSPEQRLALLDQAERVSPPVFRWFLFSGNPGFYHMVPNTSYEGVYGAEFTTNDLGFRTVQTSPKPNGVRRLVVVGDSWTFAPFVPEEARFTRQLERMLNRQGERWQVYNLGMMGWTTENAVAALRTLLPQLKPDVVVFCPTPNDADESFTVWGGRLVSTGFTTRAIFRHSYLTELRWTEALKSLQHEADWLAEQEIATLLYFVADWRGMAPYYAKLAGLTVPAVVLPGDYVAARYRLPASVDPGEHATEQGNGLIAAYLHNTLVARGLAEGLEPIPLDREVALLDQDYDRARVEDEFRWARDDIYKIHGPDMIPIDPDYMLRRGIYSVPADSTARNLRIDLRLIDSPALYPLEVEIRLAAPEATVERRVFERFQPGVQSVTLVKPASLDPYDFVEVLLNADRATVPPGKAIPVSMFRPTIEIE